MKPSILFLTLFLILAFSACKKDDIDEPGEFTLTSSAVVNGEILDEFKCETKVNDVENSIPLAWSNVPEAAKSLAIMMYHYPNPADTINLNSYLLLWDIDPSVTEMPYGTADDGPWFMGSNKDGTAISYTSPCSQGTGTHEYHITIYALSATPSTLPDSSSLAVDYATLKAAISTVTVVDKTTLTFNSVN
ncbi:MAG: YbhB/YbcL family Raf kinase inhibitor-like protein [Bacteroidia bacterium]|nr:YbhB/YbcL family Raf kinase inhibitor-like protein [Bacteroidia bacterium]